jgi:hypothetical protein
VHRRHDHARSLGWRSAPLLALLVVTAVAACSGGGPECAPSEVFATEAGPEDAVDDSSPGAPEVGEARLLHEEGAYAFFLVEQSELRGQVCVWVEQDAAFLSSGCSAQGVDLWAGPDGGVGVVYDAKGDVEREAPSSYHVVDSCLAVNT